MVKKLIRHFRYNILVLFGVGMQLITAVLNLSVFGVSAKADVLFLSSMIVVAVGMISQFYIEQFWVFYAQEKQVDHDSANRFYRSALTVAILLQIILVALLFIFLPIVLQFFAHNLDKERFDMLWAVMSIQLCGILLYPVVTINGTIINAEKKIGLGYLTQLVPPFVIVMALIGFFVFQFTNIIVYAIILQVSTVLLAITQFLILHKLGIHYKFGGRHKLLIPYLKNSFSMRIGQNINNFLQQPIVSNGLASFSEGFVSSYTYARRFAEIIYTVAVGPSFTVLRVCINDNYTVGNVNVMREAFLKFYRSALIVFPILILVYLFIGPFLTIAGLGKIDIDKIDLIKELFIVISIWLTLLIAEQPFVLLLIAAKKSLFFIVENIIYIVLLFFGTIFFLPNVGILAIPISLVIAQSFNVILNIVVGLKLIKKTRQRDNNDTL